MQNQGLSTVWDDHLSYLLSPALAAYETERVTGLWIDKKEYFRIVIAHI
jgi:centrosomal protein CEP76